MYKMSKKAIEILWKEFDVAVNDIEEILESWCGWPVFTDREEIWRWFDEQYALYGGVHALMFPDEHKKSKEADGQRSHIDLLEARKNAYRRHGTPGVPTAHVYD